MARLAASSDHEIEQAKDSDHSGGGEGEVYGDALDHVGSPCSVLLQDKNSLAVGGHKGKLCDFGHTQPSGRQDARPHPFVVLAVGGETKTKVM